jgi:hypothetical protein
MHLEIKHFGGEDICHASMDAPAVDEIINIDYTDYKVVERKFYIRTASGSMYCEVFVQDVNHPEKSFTPEPEGSRDVHTEHCCRIHGCKYGDEERCPVEKGTKQQSGPCERCDDSY